MLFLDDYSQFSAKRSEREARRSLREKYRQSIYDEAEGNRSEKEDRQSVKTGYSVYEEAEEQTAPLPDAD